MRETTEFTFEVNAPYDKVAPLFGADEERRWAKGWAPRFIHPDPAADVEGAVFLVDTIVWVNTIFDLKKGHVQYVNFNAEGVVTRIDIHITGSASTTIGVLYERTAVAPGAEDLVRKLGEDDRRKAPEWKSAVSVAAGV